MAKELIKDSRLTPELSRQRNGSKQEFYSKNRTRNPHIDGYDFTLEHPTDRAMYAELEGNVWFWISGCSECNGEPRATWKSYVECDKHNVCRTCRLPRSEIKCDVWGGVDGWQCFECADIEKIALKNERLADVADKDDDEINCNYTSNIVCPHCESSYEPETSDGLPEGKENCEVCGGEFEIEPDIEITYSTSIVGERVRS